MLHARRSTYLLPEDDGTSDEALVSRILLGQKLLFAVLVRRYNQRLFRVARAIIRDDHEAEDVVQHAYLAAYDSLASYRGGAKFGTWLTRITINEAYGRMRKNKSCATCSARCDCSRDSRKSARAFVPRARESTWQKRCGPPTAENASTKLST